MQLRLQIPLILISAVLLTGCRPTNQTFAPPRSPPVATPPPKQLIPLPEYPGRIKHILLHSKSGLVGQTSKPIFDLLSALPPKTRVTILCDDLPACNESRGRMRQYRFFDRHLLEFIKVNPPISIWARDRYIFCEPDSPDRTPFCLIPALTGRVREPGRESEHASAARTLRQFKPPVDAGYCHLAFEGGNLLASRRNVFLGMNIVTDNSAPRTPQTAWDVANELAAGLFGLPAVVIADNAARVPFIHIDMYVSIIADDHVVVASPALAAGAIDAAGEASQKALRERLFEKPPDFSPARQRMFDEIAERLVAIGFKVSRMPYTDCMSGDFIITYNNVLQSEEDGKHIVYMPTYLIPALDNAAQKAWEALGCTVRPIDVAPISHLNGAIRCLANVVERE